MLLKVKYSIKVDSFWLDSNESDFFVFGEKIKKQIKVRDNT